MNNNFYKKKALKRIGFSLLITMVYTLGSHIGLPGVNPKIFSGSGEGNESLSFILSLTGLSLDNLSLFSIGLGPWMSTLIFWRVLSAVKVFKIDSLTTTQAHFVKMFLALGIGVIQSLGIILQSGPLVSAAIPRWQLVAFMLTGLMVIIWMANMNQTYGVGGATLIILINMLRQLPKGISEQLPGISLTPFNSFLIVLGILGVIFTLFLIFRFFQGERRLPLMHVMLDGSYAKEAYLPIPINPSGGMPFMYASSMTLLPQYVLSLLGGGNSKYEVVRVLYVELGLAHTGGVLILILTAILLTYGFSYVNVDYKNIAENLRNSGDYFINIYPGKNTERYLFHKVTIMATVGALFNSVIIGLPMVVALFGVNARGWGQLLPTIIFVMILMTEVYRQFQQIYHRNDYNPFIYGEILYR